MPRVNIEGIVPAAPNPAVTTRYEPVIGLEVHVQLLTRTKAFCGCLNRFGDAPNTHVCPVCLGLPGALPVLNRAAVELAVRAALALECTIHNVSIFARKNYFYPDLAKGYQISQYDRPLATGGKLELVVGGAMKTVGIERIHMEEDAGKLLHEGFPWSAEKSGVDFNRSGVPLIEIVSRPDIRSAEEAYEYLTALKSVLLYTAVSDGNMEEGSLRCDANVSVRPVGREAFGTRTEIKNLNSFRNVSRAIEYEAARHGAVLDSGGRITQETRLWNADRNETVSMRSKEDAHDYRYFPEPDLPPLNVSDEWIARSRANLPELPAKKRGRFVSEYGLPAYDAAVLTSSKDVADYFEVAVKGSGHAKATSNWVMTEVLRKLKEDGLEIKASPLSSANLAELVDLIEAGTISGKIAKSVFEKIWASSESPRTVVEREGLVQIRDEGAVQSAVDTALAENPDAVATYRKGKTGSLGFLVGAVLKKTAGKANPQLVNTLLRKALDSDTPPS